MKLLQDLKAKDRELIETIMRKDANSLTEHDKVVLRARRDYITDADWKKLMGKTETAVETQESETRNRDRKANKTAKQATSEQVVETQEA